MSTILGVFKFKFEGDNKDLNKSIDDSEKKGSSLGKTLGSIGKIAGGVALGAGITAAPGYLMDAARAAAEDEAATIRLDLSLSNLAEASGTGAAGLAEMQDSMGGLIDAGQKLAFSDDEVRDGMQFLIAATGDYDESARRMAAAQDLARGANIPLAQATKMLGKMNEENVEVFKKLGITMGDNATEAEALAAVQAKFGGQAEAYANSTAGQFAQSELAMAELQETIGTALLPVMAALGGILVDVVIPAFGLLTPVMTLIGEGLGFLAGHLEIVIPALAMGLVPVIIMVIPLLYAKAAAWWLVATAMIAANLPIILLIAAFVAVGIGIGLLIKYWDDIVEVIPALGIAVDAVKQVWIDFVAWIKDPLIPALISVYETVAKVAQDVYDIIKVVWDKIEPLVMFYVGAWLAVIELGWNAMKIYIETVLGVIKGLVDVFMGVFTGDWDRAWSGVKQIFSSVWDGIKAIVGLAIDFLLTQMVPRMLTAAKALGTALKDGIVAGIKGILGNVGEIGDALKSALRSALQSALNWLHNNVRISVPGFDPPGPGSIPGWNWSFPQLYIPMAEGGIVTRPTLALVGEAGPEAVIPLADWRKRATGGLGGARQAPGSDRGIVVNIDTVYATSAEEARLSVNRVAYGLRAKMRKSGTA